MKKSLISLCFVSVLFSGFSLFAQSEITRKVTLDSSYINSNTAASYKEWTGTYSPSEINTAQQIKDIGHRLGNGITYQESVQDEELPYNKGNPAYKYSSARIYGKDKRGADVLLIGQTATVDTIKCLKLIIRGYLESAFGCSEIAARGIAEDICYWNTNNYGNNDFFASNFEDGVTEVFAGRYKNVGLSENYKDWKQSIIVIPHEFAVPASAYSEPVYEQESEVDFYQPELEPAETKTYQNESVENNRQSTKYEAQKQKNSSFGILMTALAVLVVCIIVVIIILVAKGRKHDDSL